MFEKELAALACAAGLVVPLRAQTVLPPPLVPASAPAGVTGLRFTPDLDAIRALTAQSSIVLAGFAMPNGTTVDLLLTRLDPERNRFRFYVDGVERPRLLEGLDLSIWKGQVVGEADSSAMLSFSRHGSRGWIQRANELVHVMPRPGANDDWSAGDVLVVDEAALNAIGAQFEGRCKLDEVSLLPREARIPAQIPPQPLIGAASCSARECKISVTSDFQFYQRFFSVPAQTAYVTTLFTYVDDRYETQANTVLTFPYVAFYTNASDPWATPDAAPPNDCGDVLNELQAAWAGNVPNGGNLGHLMSGANLGCGVAWLDVLCDPNLSFSVSGNLAGNVPFPIVQGPTNWDFIVVSHEIGHNFNALHTHDYCPPLDQCPPSQYFGACQTQQVCSNAGTIMSYCHLCAGGTSNINPFFHAQSAADMTAAAAACLPLYSGITADHPTLIAPNTPTVLNAVVHNAPTGPVQLFYRFFGGAWSSVSMTNVSPEHYGATLPPAACGATPQFYYQFTSACGTVTAPAGAPSSVYAPQLGIATPIVQDSFETDAGWTTSVAGATGGAWQRGVPVNDASWAYDPTSDSDGSGSCWLTQNVAGNSDVDGGSVTLVSPAYDLAGTAPTISYAYFLRLTGTGTTDRLLVEISSNGTSGPWTTIATHATDGGLTWRTNAIPASALSSAGVAITSNMRLRFTANDGNPQTIVEAGLDALRIESIACADAGSNYCGGDATAVACPCGNTGSSGNGCASSSFPLGARLWSTGSASLTNETLSLEAQNLTGTSCVFFQGDAPIAPTPIDDGLGCVGGVIVRLGTKVVGGNASAYPGIGSQPVSVRGLVPPAGGLRYYQCFYRNAASFCTPATSNRTNGVAIQWTP